MPKLEAANAREVLEALNGWIEKEGCSIGAEYLVNILSALRGPDQEGEEYGWHTKREITEHIRRIALPAFCMWDVSPSSAFSRTVLLDKLRTEEWPGPPHFANHARLAAVALKQLGMLDEPAKPTVEPDIRQTEEG